MIRTVRFSILVLVTIIVSAMTPMTAASAGGTHVVQPGETLSVIAARYGTSVSALQAANGLSNPNRITAGMTLVIPGPAYGQSSGSASPGYAPAQPSYGYSAPATRSLPPQGGGYVSPKSAACTNPYHVQPGDGLSSIAARCGVALGALASANGLSPNSGVAIGQMLTIPLAGGGYYTVPTPLPSRGNYYYYPTLPAAGNNPRPAATATPPPSKYRPAATPTPRIEPPLEWW